MRRWFALVVALAVGTCGAKRARPSPAEDAPRAASAPAFPGPVAVDPALAPPLGGAAEGLDITSMVRTETTYRFDVDAAWLGTVQGGAGTPFLRTLAAHPGWRVHEGPDGPRASLRGHDLALAPDGYHRAGRSAWAVHVQPGAAIWGAADPVVRVAHTAPALTVKGHPIPAGPAQGLVSSAFEIRGPAWVVGVHEVGPADAREGTEQALTELARSLDVAASTVDLVARDGVRGMYLPLGEPGAAPSVAVRAVPGGLDVRARVAPPGWGWSWVRLVRDGVPWEEARVGAGTREMLGYDGPAAHFYLQGAFAAPPGEGFEAVAEVWFAEGPRATPVRVGSWPVSVPARR